MKRLVKSAEQAWKEDFENFVAASKCVSKLEDAVNLNEPDYSDCFVEMWWFHDCGEIVMYFRNTDTNYYWKSWCPDWYGFFGNVDLLFSVTTGVEFSDNFKKRLLGFVLKSESNDYKHCDIEDTPFTIEDFYDLANSGIYVETLSFDDEYQEFDEKVLAYNQYMELVELIEGKTWEEIMELDIKNEYRADDDTDTYCEGLFGYIYYKNCRFQIYEHTEKHNLCLDRYNIDVYSDCAYHCDGDSVEDVNIHGFLEIDKIVTHKEEVKTIKISQESLDKFKEVEIKQYEPKEEISKPTFGVMGSDIDAYKVVIESIKKDIIGKIAAWWDCYDKEEYEINVDKSGNCYFNEFSIDGHGFIIKEKDGYPVISVEEPYYKDFYEVQFSSLTVEELLFVWGELSQTKH